MSIEEPNLIKEFRELYDYVRLLGTHVNSIHSRLEKIEANINELNVTHSNSLKENAIEIAVIRENMVNKNEFNDFIEKLKASFNENLPPLPPTENPEQIQEMPSSSPS
jgi:DNA anti-recombination protein RmuC